jgi:hypothetical protein
MAKRIFGTGLGLRTWLLLAMAVITLCALPAVLAQQSLDNPLAPSHAVRPRVLPDRLPDKPSQPPAFKIPVGPLGFSAPGAFYLGQRTSLVSLDFLDEDLLLFTFRVPGLIRREAAEHEAGEEEERRIRAVVLKLPAGTVEAEALWTVHDHARYLWMLKDGSFLLRDRNNLELGDASLELKPYLRFPGPLLWLEMDPTQQFLVTNSREPDAAAQKPSDAPNVHHPSEQDLSQGTPDAHHPSDQDLSLGTPDAQPGDVDLSLRPSEQKSLSGNSESLGLRTPSPAETHQSAEKQKPAGKPDLAVRVLRRDSGQVILVSRTRTAVHLPVNADGYLESLRTRTNGWLLNLNYFSGGSAILGQVDSACSPLFDFLSQRQVLVTGCTASGAGKLEAVATDGRRLWEAQSSETTVWPLVVRAPDGSRLALETLVLPYPVSARTPLDPEEIKGQLVEVLDAADGNLALETTASPALDAGGNVAISPLGRRVAVLNGGQIQVYELPPAPPLPEPATHPPARGRGKP